MKFKIIFCFLLIFITRPVAAQSAAWSMKDIELAHRNKNFKELERHILSIPPTDRNQNWIEALRDTISDQIEDVRAGEDILINLDTLDLLKPYLSGNTISYEFRVKVAKFLRLHTQQQALALEWFRNAITIEPNKQSSLCTDKDLELAVLAGLHLSPDDAQTKNAIYFADVCYVRLESQIKSSLAKANDYGFANICPILKSKNTLTGSLLELKCEQFIKS